MGGLKVSRVVRTLALGLGTVLVIIATPMTAGATAAPAVKLFKVSPMSVSSAGGRVTLTAKVTHAKTCAFSITPHVGGLPITRTCSSGGATTTFNIPANGLGTSRAYTVKLTVKGSGGTATATKRISQAAKPLSRVKSVVGRSDSFCAVLVSGGVDCWGFNGFGQLGNGTTRNSNRPTAVKGLGGKGTLTGVASVVSGPLGYGDSYCAVLVSGGVDCWGYNHDGELGNGTATKQSDSPAAVKSVGGAATLSGVTQVSAEIYGFCALLRSHGVVCWGLNEYGELGNGTFTGSTSPVEVVGIGGSGTLSGVARLVSENASMCAVLTSAGLVCWGYGPNGQLGNGTASDSAVPTAVKGLGGSGTLTGVTSLTGNGNGTNICARLASGHVDCWGDNTWGEIGNGTIGIFNDSSVPVAVKGAGGHGTLSGVSNVIGVPGLSNCAIFTSGRVDCWGYNGGSVLGNPADGGTSDVPTIVVGVSGKGTLGKVRTLVANGGGGNGAGICAVLTSSSLDCWGYASSGYSTSPKPVLGVGGTGILGAVHSLASDDSSASCTVQTSGDVYCWGENIVGQLGNGSTTSSVVPEVVVAA